MTKVNRDLEKKMAVSKENALNKFIGQIGEISERLAELQEYTENHMNYSPEEINWGHVGTAGWFLERLTELADSTYGRGEFAE